ncbi:MAG TPA: hypothetical protein VKY26_06430 [Actinomycetota bacterium]|nr:hypothetical protein [Actinomycetota bacterium]
MSLAAAAVVARRRNRPGASLPGASLLGASLPGGQGAVPVEGRGAAKPANGRRPVVERRASADPQALQALVDGTPSRVGFDVQRLETLKEANYKPLMEYLQYIQVQRGGGDTLVFVRTRDLDQLAGLVGQERDEFLSQFKKLGVLLSMN